MFGMFFIVLNVIKLNYFEIIACIFQLINMRLDKEENESKQSAIPVQ